MIGRLPPFLPPFQEFFQTVSILRAPLLVSIVSLLLLSTPTQVLELYLILARDWQRLALQLGLAGLSLACLCFFLALVSRALTRTDEDVNAQRTQSSAQGTITRSMPLILGLLPLAGCAIGLLRALSNASTEILRRTSETIAAFKVEGKVDAAYKAWQATTGDSEKVTEAVFKRIDQLLNEAVPAALLKLPAETADLTIAIYTGVAACVIVGLVLSAIFAPGSMKSDGAVKNRLFHPVTSVFVVLVFAGIIAVFAGQAFNLDRSFDFDFTRVPRTLGTITIVNLSLTLLLLLCSMLTRWSDKSKVPVLSTLVVLGFVFSFFNWNDNHDVRLLESTQQELETRKVPPSDKMPPDFVDAFQAWLARRPPEYMKKFEGRPYPIYMVAAQGGGMYAANLGGLALARTYDRCPAIRHHLFGISGVSGGSVGAGFLAAVLNDPAMAPTSDTCVLDAPAGKKKGPIETTMEKLLQKDFLSPVTASLVFPDMLQRLIPYPVKVFDRARAFEAGVEQAWDDVMKSPNPLRRPFWQHWRPDGTSPMLFLNTTIAETGHQIAIAPVEIEPTFGKKSLTLQSMQEIFELDTKLDVPLSTAMSLSARFPLIMPAGRLKLEKLKREVRLVDGGYFENSGTEAGIALINRLKDNLCQGAKAGRNIDYSNCIAVTKSASKAYAFRLIVLTDYDAMADALRDPSTVSNGLNEILSPVRTMYNARVARGELIVGRMAPFMPKPGEPTLDTTVPTVMVSLNPQLYSLPLGWQLSSQVQSIISAQIGDPAQCGYGPGSPAYGRAWYYAGGVDEGLRLLKLDEGARKRIQEAAREEGAEKDKARRDAIKEWRTPFMNMLYMLKTNQCSIFGTLGADGIAPTKGICAELYKAEGRAIQRAAAISAAEKNWAAEVEQKHGKAWAKLDHAQGSVSICTPSGDGNFQCSFEASPCDPLYFQLTEGAQIRR